MCRTNFGRRSLQSTVPSRCFFPKTIDDESTLQLFYNSIFRDIKMLKKIVNNLLMISVVETNECFLFECVAERIFRIFRRTDGAR